MKILICDAFDASLPDRLKEFGEVFDDITFNEQNGLVHSFNIRFRRKRENLFAVPFYFSISHYSISRRSISRCLSRKAGFLTPVIS